jgi:hypothetical protein
MEVPFNLEFFWFKWSIYRECLWSIFCS